MPIDWCCLRLHHLMEFEKRCNPSYSTVYGVLGLHFQMHRSVLVLRMDG